MTVLANFVEVFLAKEGHQGLVGINYLEKVQIPTLPSLLGAMLAGVDYVLMGAGVPRAIPGTLDRLAAGDAVQLKIDVSGMPAGPRDHQPVGSADVLRRCAIPTQAPAVSWPSLPRRCWP